MSTASTERSITLHPSGNTTGKPATPYLLNCWYAAALSTELPTEGLMARQLLDTSVLLYRTESGTPVALHDRCSQSAGTSIVGPSIGAASWMGASAKAPAAGASRQTVNI